MNNKNKQQTKQIRNSQTDRFRFAPAVWSGCILLFACCYFVAIAFAVVPCLLSVVLFTACLLLVVCLPVVLLLLAVLFACRCLLLFACCLLCCFACCVCCCLLCCLLACLLAYCLLLSGGKPLGVSEPDPNGFPPDPLSSTPCSARFRSLRIHINHKAK